MEEAGRIVNGVYRVRVKPIGGTGYSPLTVIPTYPDLPMEEVFVRPTDEHDAGVFLNEVGRGRVIYFPWDIDRTFWEVLDLDHAHLLRNAVNWATTPGSACDGERAGNYRSFGMEPERFHDAPHRQPDESHDDERAGKRDHPHRTPASPYPAYPRASESLKSAAIRSPSRPAYREHAGFLEAEVPSINLHEVIALDLAG